MKADQNIVNFLALFYHYFCDLITNYKDSLEVNTSNPVSSGDSRALEAEADLNEFVGNCINLRQELSSFLQSPNYEKVNEILDYMLWYIDGEDSLTPEFEQLLIDQKIFPILYDFLQDLSKEDIFCNTIYILDQLVYLSTQNETPCYQILKSDGVLDILLTIRESIPFKILPTYLHLVSHFSYCDEETRDAILVQFSPEFLINVIAQQGESEYKLRKWGIYFIRMMTMYPFYDGQFKDFPQFIITFFLDIFQSLDKICLLYFLYALENIIIMHNTDTSHSLVSVEMMTAFNFQELIHYFIQNRNKGVVNDEILSIILKITQYLLKCNRSSLDEGIVPALLEIVNDNYEISSSLAIDIIIDCISQSSPFKESAIRNCSAEPIVAALWQTFTNSAHQIQVKILCFFDELVGTNLQTDISLTIPFIQVILPYLILYLHDVTNPEIITKILSIFDDILFIGDLIQYMDSILQIFMDNNIFEFLSNYENILMDCSKKEFDVIKAQVNCIMEYFSQSFEEEDGCDPNTI